MAIVATTDSAKLLFAFLALHNLSSYGFHLTTSNSRLPHITSCHLASCFPSSILISSIETFDGSQIVDPVIVSGVFWSSLKTRLISLVIGQLFATIVFGILATVTASQLSKVGDWVASILQSNDEQLDPSTGIPRRKRFVKANEIKYTPIPVDLAKLGICILIDVIGSSSELLPIIGEVTDFAWAPIAALWMRQLFYGSNVVLVLEFVEEVLPFTDILPLATLCWVLDTFFADSLAAQALGLGINRRVTLDDNTAIDVTIPGGRTIREDENN